MKVAQKKKEKTAEAAARVVDVAEKQSADQLKQVVIRVEEAMFAFRSLFCLCLLVYTLYRILKGRTALCS